MINPNDKSKVTNLCSFPVSWVRETLSGDEYLKANASTYITNAEIQTQIENGNRFFVGSDGVGSHADVYIDNNDIREQYGFDSKENNKKQLIVNNEKCEYILNLKTISAFEKNLKEYIITNSEKMRIMEVARKIKLDEYSKIQKLEEYCNIKFD